MLKTVSLKTCTRLNKRQKKINLTTNLKKKSLEPRDQIVETHENFMAINLKTYIKFINFQKKSTDQLTQEEKENLTSTDHEENLTSY